MFLKSVSLRFRRSEELVIGHVDVVVRKGEIQGQRSADLKWNAG